MSPRRSVQASILGQAMVERREHPPSILLVDDDAALRTALTFNLGIEGFQVESYDSGEALLLRHQPPATCLLLDQNLPGVSGLDALRQLRRRGVNAPAVIMTSHPSLRLRREIAELGAQLVEKPLLGDGLISTLRAVIAAHAAAAP